MELDTLEDVHRRNNGKILEEIPKAMKKHSTNQIPKALKELEKKEKDSDYDKTENLINKNNQNSNLHNNFDSTRKLDDMTKVMSRQNLDKIMNSINSSKEKTYKNTISEDLGELPKALNHNPLENIGEGEEQYEKDNIAGHATNLNNSKVKKKKKKRWKVLKIFLITIFMLVCLFVLFIILFFKTTLFQEWKELWVQTAMTTMNHQYLATWFLSEDEINAIMSDNVVINNEDSILNAIELDNDSEKQGIATKPKENLINIDKISGSGYVGYVMTVSDPSKVKFVDARKKTTGTQLSQICKEHNAIAGINAGGFTDPNGNGFGNLLNEPTIIDKKLLFGDKNTVINLTGLTHAGELVLGRYTYHQAMNIGVESGIQFGPYIIVNGNKQIKKANQGGLHPRMAIGQKKDGTMIFVCIDGRQPGYSIGTTLLELQNIFERYGAYNAANLDGGSSATMYYNGKVINKTSTPIGERYLPNAIIVTK